MSPEETPRPKRIFYLILGWSFFVLGIIGIVLPVMPTSPFIILAAWAFSKSSKRFESWLVHHKYFGPSIRRWRAYRVIPPIAKFFSVGAMTVTLTVSLLSGRVPWWGLFGEALFFGWGAWFILSCPSHPPEGAPEVPD